MGSNRLESTSAPGAASALSSSELQPEQASRRRLFGWLWGVLLAGLAGEIVWVTTSFLRRPRTTVLTAPPLFVAGPVGQFAENTVTAFPGGKFYLARLPGGGFLALDRSCTHLGCTVPWNAEQACFQCPCHASSFAISGAVLAPPAPRPLDLYPVRIENGIVKVDTSRRVRRSAYDPTQEAHA
jgi:cytochrome b6-f complex iron-sulfur subunit